ncbi:PaaI family thioesterase [Pseudomonas sp. Fl5BN2]|uniref:PaaI family thioesterase n=1 Tax=Pseudomonas sp. Fl5BN2 TaxID=2697652 RepID=UPI00137764F1|nr:PaaI family thioesterase [Pseudomonas sp. Fl5BN2]NBF01359.1 PaaI family thioesterase [Pseudomonas sp. Fl5BN2]
MSEDLKALLDQAHQQGDYGPLLGKIPYAALIGIECSRLGDELLFRLPANKDNIGNPLLPALHGGVIAGFMELAAALHLLIFTGSPGVPKIIDFSLDYLRAGQFRDTFARCQVCRQGRRVANVAITAWQSNADEPIATARAHFKIEESPSP